MNPRPVLAFDCFGTVFDMSSVPREEINAYVNHVRQPEWSPYTFPESWMRLTAHPDAAEGIYQLKKKGIECWAFSNGSRDLIGRVSLANDIHWDRIIDLSIPKVYKPHARAYEYLRDAASSRVLNIVTANLTFGDIEGAESIGVRAHVIRHGKPETIVDLAEMFPDYERPKQIKVECNNCLGYGEVFYAPGHPLVQLRQAEAWKTYTCPICQGSKFLIRETGRVK